MAPRQPTATVAAADAAPCRKLHRRRRRRRRRRHRRRRRRHRRGRRTPPPPPDTTAADAAGDAEAYGLDATMPTPMRSDADADRRRSRGCRRPYARRPDRVCMYCDSPGSAVGAQCVPELQLQPGRRDPTFRATLPRVRGCSFVSYIGMSCQDSGCGSAAFFCFCSFIKKPTARNGFFFVFVSPRADTTLRHTLDTGGGISKISAK